MKTTSRLIPAAWSTHGASPYYESTFNTPITSARWAMTPPTWRLKYSPAPAPKKSVLNKFNQMWDAKNVFVIDGAAYVGSANQNPTLTILALTIRACEYLTEEMKSDNL